MKSLWSASLFAATVCGATTDAHAELRLKTQFDESIQVLPPMDSALVLVYSDRAGAAQAPGWLKLARSAPCRRLEAANLESVPAIARPFVGRAFHKSSPILMDWHGELAAALGFEANAANVYLIEANGKVRAHLHGPADGAGTASFQAQLRSHCGAAEPARVDPPP